MPAHSSHLLQPLDVGCFSVLKPAYSKQVVEYMRLGINHIDKIEFITAFKTARNDAMIASNIRSGFIESRTGALHHLTTTHTVTETIRKR